MNLNEAVDLLQEMIKGCPDLSGDDFLLASSKIPESIVDGYQVHMTGKFSDQAKKYLNDIAVSRRLAIVQHPGSVMIFKAKTLSHAKNT